MTGTSKILSPIERVILAIGKSTKKNDYNPLPERVTDTLLTDLIHDGIAFTASRDPYSAAMEIREARGRLVILPYEHRVHASESNRKIKDVRAGSYLFIDSRPVIRIALQRSKDFAERIGKQWSLPDGKTIDDITYLSDEVLQATGMYPKFQYAAAFDHAIKKREAGEHVEPPIGLYWVGPDGKVRAITWMRSHNGHERYRAAKEGNINVKLDKEFYGESMSAVVESESDPGTKYPIDLGPLPIFRPEDRRQHSTWRAFETTDNDPDARYRGRKDQRRAKKRYFMSSNTVMIYDLSAARLRETQERGKGMEIQINMFPEFRPEGKEFARLMNEQALIGNCIPNMTEAERLFGADTINAGGFHNNFYNWTFRTIR